jgi:hypothetical protein
MHVVIGANMVIPNDLIDGIIDKRDGPREGGRAVHKEKEPRTMITKNPNTKPPNPAEESRQTRLPAGLRVKTNIKAGPIHAGGNPQ